MLYYIFGPMGLANSADPNQASPRRLKQFCLPFHLHLFNILRLCSNFRMITANFSGVRKFRDSNVLSVRHNYFTDLYKKEHSKLMRILSPGFCCRITLFTLCVQMCKQMIIVGGWVGRWCWVASSAGASYYFGIWQGKGLLCLQQVRDGWAMFYLILLISSVLSSFSNASSIGRRLDILK